jgi:Na+/H+ antiporter NhaC
LHQALNPKIWWLLRVLALNYIAYAFAVDFLNHPVHGDTKHVVAYLPFAILAIAGPIMRLIAFTLRISQVWRGPSYRAG